jgi:hypothetical protein
MSQRLEKRSTCGGCRVGIGQQHIAGCDIERCAICGSQLIGCDCVYDIAGVHPEPGDFIYENGPTSEMWDAYDAEVAKLGGPLTWQGHFPGTEECIEFGLFDRWEEGRGWVPCGPDDDGAGPGLNRLPSVARWDKSLRRWVRLNQSKSTEASR